MIAVTNLGKAYGSQTLFGACQSPAQPGLPLRAGRRQRLRQKHSCSGSSPATKNRVTALVSVPKRLRLGVLSQDHFRFEDTPILDVTMMGHQELWQALAEKDRILEAVAEHFDGDRYAEVEDLIVSLDGYSFEARPGEILEGLGIPSELHGKPLSTLSGGFKLRVLLAQVLAADPGCLLLDEPTNHLDILSIRWLERFLATYPGCAVVISHDHRFLDNVCTHILDIDYETVTLYTGNYTAFTKAKGGSQSQRGRNRAPGEEDRRAQGLRRPLPSQGHQGASGAEQAQTDGSHRRRAPAHARRVAIRCSDSASSAPAARKRSRSRVSQGLW